jgi:hypothetical protein
LKPIINWRIWLLALIVTFSVLPTFQSLAIDVEQVGVLFWRSLTKNFPIQDKKIILVHIDKNSLNAAGIRNRLPLDRAYLAKIVNKLGIIGAKNIGLDYVLDKATDPKSDKMLSDSIRNIAKDKSSKFVFASTTENGKEVSTLPELKIDDLEWSLQGNTKFPTYFASLNECPYIFDLWTPQSNSPTPFSYWLAMMSKSSSRGSGELRESLIKESNIDFESIATEKSHHWFQSIIDYSIPPEFIYEVIPSEQLLDGSAKIDNPEANVFLIAPGGYLEAGIEGPGADNYHIPWAIRFRLLGELKNSSGIEYFRDSRGLTGGEVHAYMANQLLNKSLVQRLPDWILVGLVVALAILFVFITTQSHRQTNGRSRLSNKIILLVLNSAFILFCLDSYCKSGLFLPYLYPSVSIWAIRLIILDKSLCLMPKKETNA